MGDAGRLQDGVTGPVRDFGPGVYFSPVKKDCPHLPLFGHFIGKKAWEQADESLPPSVGRHLSGRFDSLSDQSHEEAEISDAIRRWPGRSCS